MAEAGITRPARVAQPAAGSGPESAPAGAPGGAVAHPAASRAAAAAARESRTRGVMAVSWLRARRRCLHAACLIACAPARAAGLRIPYVAPGHSVLLGCRQPQEPLTMPH